MHKQKRALIVSIVVSAFATYLLYLFANNFVHIVDLSLNRLFNIRMGPWELLHIVFALSISCLPVFSWIAWKIRKETAYTKLLQYNLGALVLFITITTMPFLYLLAKSRQDPEAYYTIIRQPSILFWNLVLIIASIMSAVLVVLHGLIKRAPDADYTASKNEILDN